MKRYMICLIFFFLILTYPFYACPAVMLDRVIAVVNDDVITWSELYKMMENEASEQLKSMSEEDRLKIFRSNEPVFLEKLIDFRLQLQEAKRIGMSVSREELKEAIENIKSKYSMTDKMLEENLKKEGISMDEYKKILSEQILVNQFLNRKIRSKIVVTDEEIKKYIDENKETLTQNETYKIKQIFFKKPADDSERKTIEEKAMQIIERIKNGEDFSKLAKEYSEDASGQQGGELGVVNKDILAKEFIDAISKIKIGEITKPFWTEKGLHIIKLDAKLSPANPDEMKELVSKQLNEQKFLEKYRSLIKDLREKARIEVRL